MWERQGHSNFAIGPHKTAKPSTIVNPPAHRQQHLCQRMPLSACASWYLKHLEHVFMPQQAGSAWVQRPLLERYRYSPGDDLAPSFPRHVTFSPSVPFEPSLRRQWLRTWPPLRTPKQAALQPQQCRAHLRALATGTKWEGVPLLNPWQSF